MRILAIINQCVRDLVQYDYGLARPPGQGDQVLPERRTGMAAPAAVFDLDPGVVLAGEGGALG